MKVRAPKSPPPVVAPKSPEVRPPEAPKNTLRAQRTGAADGFSPLGMVGTLFGGIGDGVEAIVERGLKLAAGAGNALDLSLVRGALDQLLGKSSRDQIGWIQKEQPGTTDATGDLKSLYQSAKAGKEILPPEADDYVYLTLRGYTGDNWPTYMKANREGLARKGLDVREIHRDTEQTVEHNAKIVRDAVLAVAKEGKQVVLIGHSKGGMDMTAAVAMYPEIKPYVRAAVAMQAPYGGVPVASDVQDQKILSKIAGKTIEWGLGGDEASMTDFSYAKRKAFIQRYPWPTDIPTVSLATSSSSQLTGLTPVINWYKLRYGEKTDGIVAQRDSEIPGSKVVRLDNLDHLNSVMPEFPGRANWDPGVLTEALVALALQQ